tara:strand:- start:511 stop:1197 length:687 start_codon:yes stop_codon:yes gene_type:complete
MVGRGTRLFEGKKDCIVLDCVGTSAHNNLLTLADLSSGSLDEEQVESEEKDPIQEHLLLLGDPQAHTLRVSGYSAIHFDVFGQSPVVWFEANGSRVTSDGYWNYLIYPSPKGFSSARARFNGGIGIVANGTLEEVVAETEALLIKSLTNNPKERKLQRHSKWLASRPMSTKQKGFIERLANILVKRYGSSVGFIKADLASMSTQTASTIICYLVVKCEYAKKYLSYQK